MFLPRGGPFLSSLLASQDLWSAKLALFENASETLAHSGSALVAFADLAGCCVLGGFFWLVFFGRRRINRANADSKSRSAKPRVSVWLRCLCERGENNNAASHYIAAELVPARETGVALLRSIKRAFQTLGCNQTVTQSSSLAEFKAAT